MSAATIKPEFQRFLDWTGLAPALDHALTAGFDLAHLHCASVEMPNEGGRPSLVFKVPGLGLVTFTNEGRV